MEYKLITLDIPNIMDKVEAYDKMRPGNIVSQRMITPTCRELEWDSKKEHKLFDGTPYEHGGTEKAQRYWKAMPDYDNPSEKAMVQSIIASKQGVGKKVS